MDQNKIKEVQNIIKNHQDAVRRQTPPKDIPVSAGKLTDDLSKVASNDVIGKGGESDLRK